MTRLRHLAFPSILLWFYALSGSPLLAQGEAAPAPGGDISGSFMTYIVAGGWTGYIIIALSILAVTLIIEHFINIKRDKLAPAEAIDEVEELLQEGNYQEVLEYCEAEPTFFTNVVAAGVRKLNYSFPAVEKAIEEMEDEESVKLQQKIGWLSLVAAVSPMLGLFGTVTGMVGAFGTIATAGAGGVEPADFAGDIMLALVTTVQGLFVAIPVTGFFAFFRARVTMISLEVGAVVEEMFERFRPAE